MTATMLWYLFQAISFVVASADPILPDKRICATPICKASPTQITGPMPNIMSMKLNWTNPEVASDDSSTTTRYMADVFGLYDNYSEKWQLLSLSFGNHTLCDDAVACKQYYNYLGFNILVPIDVGQGQIVQDLAITMALVDTLSTDSEPMICKYTSGCNNSSFSLPTFRIGRCPRDWVEHVQLVLQEHTRDDG